MRKFLLLIFFSILLSILSFSQALNQVDDQGWKQGKWRKSYVSGVIKYEGQFRNDRPYGEFRYYHENSQIKAITKFSDDGIIAYTESFHENGKPMAMGKYINQKRDSTWNFYSDIDGKIIAKEDYRKGKLNGKSILFYVDSGKPAEITEYKQGVKEGTYLKYFPDGKTMTEGLYHNDQLHGDFTVYYNDETIEIKGRYENGRKSGNWEYFTENGKPITEEQYKLEKQ